MTAVCPSGNTRTIAPGHYYLVQEAQGSGGTNTLPTPDAIGAISMSASSGKIALVNGATARALGLRSVLDPGRKTPGLVTLRESRVNAAKGQSSPVSDLIFDSLAFETASVPTGANQTQSA